MLCTVLLIVSSETSFAQVIHNTGGAVMSVSSGTVITADTITNDGISSINNEGTINVTVLINNGAMTGNGVYNVVGTFTNTGTFTPGTSEFDFSSSSPQTIPAINYYNLTVSGTGARTLANSGTIGISGVFTPGTNSYTITGSTIDFNSSGAQTIPAFNYNNLTSSSTGTRTLDNSGTIGIAGTFTPGTNSYTITGSTVNFNGSGGQTIPTFNFNNLTSSSTGARTLVNGGTIGIAGTFTPGTNAYTITNNTIDFNGSGAQTIPVFNGVTGYNNLTLSNSASKSTPSGTTTTVVAGNFTLNSGITYAQAGGAASTLTLNGTSNTISGELGSVANPFTTINLGNGNGDATTISATTGSLNSGTVAIGAFNITVTNNNIANISGNLTGGAAGATWVNATNSSLSVGGTLLTTGTLTATASPNTVTYNNTAAGQAVKATTYHHLVIDKTDQTATVTGATTINGNLSVTSGNLAVGNSVFTVSGTTTVNDSLSFTNATGAKSFVDVNLNSNGSLSFTNTPTVTISGNLTMDNTSSISGSATGVINVTNNLNITGTGVTIGRSTITVTDSTVVTGDVNFNNVTGTKTFVGPVVISGSGSWSSSANSAFTLRNGLVHNGTSFSSGTGIYSFTTNAQTLNGTSQLIFANLTVTTITLTDSNSHASGLTVTTNLSGTGGLTMPTNGLLTIGGTSGITTLTVMASPNTVVYNGTTVAQTVKGTTYYNLEMNGNNQVKTLGANTNVNNQLLVTAGTLNLSTFNLIMGASAPIVLNDSLLVTSATGTRTWSSMTINSGGTFSCSAAETFTVSGDWTNNGGTFTPGTSTITFNGSGPQAINGTAATQTFNNIIVNNSADTLKVNGSTTTLTLNGTFTQTLGDFISPATMNVVGAITFTTGKFTAGTDFNVGGGWTAATGTVFVTGSGTVTFNGAGAQSIAGTLVTKTFNNLVINKTVGQTLSSGGSTATITVNGTLTQTQGNFTPPATLNVTGNTTLTAGTFSIGSGTKTLSLDLNINGTAIVSSSNAAAVINVGGDLNMAGTGSITGTATGTFTVTGNLNINGTANTIGRSTVNVTDTTLVAGNVDFNSVTGTKTFIGPVVISSGATWAASGNPSFVLRNGLTHNGTSFSSGTGTYTFNTNNQDINSSSSIIFSGAVGITGAITVTNKTNLTITGALTGSVAGSTLANDVNDTLSFGNAVLATGTLTATASPNTVRYTSTTAAQTIKGTTYHHLIIDKTGQVGTIGAATVVNGDVTVTNGTFALAAFAFTASGTTNVNGTLSVTSATGTKSFADLNMNASSILTASAAATFNVSGNLTMGNSSSITGSATNVVSVTGNLNIPGTSVTIGNSTITVTDTTLVTGDVNFNSATGTKTFIGPVVLNSGASWSSSSNSAFTLRGGLTHNGTTFSSGTGTYTFNTNNQNISGSSSITFDGVVAISGAITVTNYTTVTLTTNLTGSVGGSTWFNEANSTLNVGAALLTTGTLNASGNPNTINYTGGVQTVKGGIYHHLLLSAAGAKTASAAVTVNGNLTLSSTASLNDAGFQIVGNASGTFSVSSGSTLTLGSVATATLFPTNFVNANITLDAASTVVYNSDQAQTISVVPTYGNLTLTATGTVIKTISGAATVATDLTVGTNNTLSITGAGSVQINTGNLILNGSLDNNGTIDVGL